MCMQFGQSPLRCPREPLTSSFPRGRKEELGNHGDGGTRTAAPNHRTKGQKWAYIQYLVSLASQLGYP